MSGALGRHSRFWIVGIVLIVGNGFYLGYGLVQLHQRPTIPELSFHGMGMMAGVGLLDWEVASGLLKRVTQLVTFWRRGDPPSDSGTFPKL